MNLISDIRSENMAKLLMFVALFVIVDAAHRHNPKFSRRLDDNVAPSEFRKVVCSSEHDALRNEIMNHSSCGVPKEVYIPLIPKATYEQLSPGAVWVKRCVGHCDYANHGSNCMPKTTTIRHIPVRIYNVKNDKASCSFYPIEEHLTCGCCAVTGCENNRRFNPQEP